jgi:hypothetical protein
LHVLGMPPAFVLSQDQTLKFIPKPSPKRDSSKQGPPNVRINARRLAAPRLSPVQPPSAHPFPLLHNLKQQPPPVPTTVKGAALIRPTPTHVNTPLQGPVTTRSGGVLLLTQERVVKRAAWLCSARWSPKIERRTRLSNRLRPVVENDSVFRFGKKEPALHDDTERRARNSEPRCDHPDDSPE